MAKQLMIYDRAVPISSARHNDWSVRQDRNYAFAKDVNSVPLLAAEFLAAAPHYAIVFAGDENNVSPSVVLGIDNNINAYVAEDGSWTGEYIPAFIRRYPFVFARSDDGATFTLCIDEEFEGFNKDGVGERLFDAEGNRTQFLESMLKFTQDYQTLSDRTQRFCDRLREHDLLEGARAQFTLPGGQQAQLAGFFTINRDKLKALPEEVLREMLQTDELELCYAHLHSLQNLTPMTRKVAETRVAAAAPQAEEVEEPVEETADT